HDFPIEPTADTLSFYVVYMCHFIKPKSVNSYLSGICNQLESFYPNVRTARNSQLVTKTLMGCTKLRATPTIRKSPLTRDQLSNMRHDIGPSPTHDDKCFLGIAFSTFHGVMRLGENTWPDNTNLQDYRKVIRRSTVSTTPSSASFLLPGHKADRLFEGNRVLLNETKADDDPVRAFKSYLDSRNALFPLNPELWLLSSGQIPTRCWFLNRLHSLIPDRNISGHSFRSGGATALALAGIPPHLIE
ncbi:hypothetical protein GALMADRAFT_39483, partial [Galerina marginata CBS 339.88]